MSPLNPNIPAEREKLRKLHRVKQNELSMIALRGFPLNHVWMMKADMNFTESNLSEFRGYDFDTFLQIRGRTGLFQDRTEFSSLYFRPDTNETLLVIYLNAESGKQVNMKNFEIVKLFIQTQRYHHIIVISELGLNPDNKGYVQDRIAGYKVEEFTDYPHFVMDPLKHKWSPITIKHVPGTQRNEWAQTENLQPEQLPMILTIDALAKRFGAEPYDIFQTVNVGSSVELEGYARIARKPPREKKKQ
jgi:hypothetical protein